jgi:hypothetical protein
MSEHPKVTERQHFWLEHIHACRDSQQSLTAYAAQHGLNVRSLYGAKKKLKRQGILEPAPGKHRFMRVTAAATRLPTASCRILLANGAVVELGCGGEEVERILQAVSRLP